MSTQPTDNPPQGDERVQPLVVQFSGGRTSGFMGRFLQLYFPRREKIYLFENTGKEHENTLEFVNRCDVEFGWNTVWLEAVIHHGRKIAPTHKVVTFETASRNGEPYENLIQKYGIQNMAYKDCTKYLKVLPKKSYLKSIGLDVGDYETAVGIRDDEKHRINRTTAAKELNIYPLVDIIKVDKTFILNWWSRQSFDLDIDPDFGNCDFCFKKSIKQLVAQVRKAPERLNWWEDMESKYASVQAPLEPRKIFRGHISAKELRELARLPLLPNKPEFAISTDCFCKST